LRVLPLPVLLLSPPSTRANAATPPGQVAPGAAASEEDLINRGIALREARDDGAALEAFRQAYNLERGARALAQVALAEQALGRWAEAETDLGQAIGRSDDPWIARNKALLNQALVEIQEHLGSLQLTGGVPGAEVLVNGASVGRLPLAKPLRVTAGSVTLEVRAPNYLPTSRTVSIPRRGLARETVVLLGAASPGAPPAPSPPAARAAGETRPLEAWPARTKVGLAFAAGAVVSAAIGTTFLFVRDGRAQDFNNAGCGTAALTPPCESLRDREETAVTWVVTGMLGAAVLGGVAAYLLLWPSGGDPGRVANADSDIGLRCAPSPGGGVSLTCSGRF
jgi:hypothetical protein